MSQTHHESAENNIKKGADAITEIRSYNTTAEKQQAYYTGQIAFAMLANTQALLAVNETLTRIADQMGKKL